MTPHITCPACGKRIDITPADRGRTIPCPACGHAVGVARLGPPPMGPTATTTTTAPTATMPTENGSVKPSVAPKSRETQGGSQLKWVLAGTGLVVVLLLVSLVYLLVTRPKGSDQEAWEAANGPQILKLKSEAEALAIAGNLAEAHKKYVDLQTLIGGRSIKDPKLWDLTDRAKADSDRVYAIILRAMANKVAPEMKLMEEPAVSATLPVQKQIEAQRVPYQGPPDWKYQGATLLPAPATKASAPPAPQAPSTRQAPVAATTPTVDPSTGAVQVPGFLPTTTPASPPPLTGVPFIYPVTKTALSYPYLTDRQLGVSIDRAVNYLILQFKDGQIAITKDDEPIFHAGINALCVYSLLQASQTSKDPRLDIQGPFVKQIIDELKRLKFEGDGQAIDGPVVYARSLRAAALAVYNREEDRKVLKADVDWLVNAAVEGAYTYDDRWSRRKLGMAPGQQQQQQEQGGAAAVKNSDTPEDAAKDDSKPRIYFHGEGNFNPPPNVTVPIRPDSRVPIPQDSRVPMGAPRDSGRPNPAGPQTAGPTVRQGNKISRVVPESPFPPMAPAREPAPREYGTLIPWDNSNSQYGLLGVWAGAECGIEVPDKYWKDVEKHWEHYQLRSGEWAYSYGDSEGRFGMTCAGIASLMVTHDYLDAPTSGAKIQRNPFSRNLTAGLAWLELGTNAITPVDAKVHYIGYNLFGLERVALATGFKQFGVNDWYREIAPSLIVTQSPDGAFRRYEKDEDNLIDTAYDLLFLTRGRHPIIMNKLRFDGFWQNRARDLSNLAKFTSRELERPFNWQVVNLQSAWTDWMDSPILYIASHQFPKFSDGDIEKIRNYVQAGGMVFTQSDTGAEGFNAFAADLAKRLFPQYEMADLPTEHPLYTLNYNMKLPRPRLRAVSNGSRLLMVHSTVDHAVAWQLRQEKTRRASYELGANLFLYAAGKTDLRNKLASPVYPELDKEPNGKLPIARVKYAGNWDPEPGAFQRFKSFFKWETNLLAEPTVVELKDLKADQYPFAHITGTAAFTPSDDAIASLKSYVESGGLLLIEACGGASAFNDSVEKSWLPRLSPDRSPQAVESNDPMLLATILGMEDASKPRLRPFTQQKIGAGQRLRSLSLGKGMIVYSPLDLSTGLLGSHVWPILGYEPLYCEDLTKDIVLWAFGRNALTTRETSDSRTPSLPSP